MIFHCEKVRGDALPIHFHCEKSQGFQRRSLAVRHLRSEKACCGGGFSDALRGRQTPRFEWRGGTRSSSFCEAFEEVLRTRDEPSSPSFSADETTNAKLAEIVKT
jgi:hypothetical protein